MTSFSRPLAVVTGASSGIGAELARVLAGRAYDVVVTARRVNRLEELAKELREKHHVEAHVIAADLSTPEGAYELVAQVKALGVPVSFLANNAGFGLYGDFVEQDPARIAEMLQLNVASLTLTTRLFAEEMVARRTGRILQVASVGAFQPSPYYAAYSATKSYVRDFSEALAFELKKSGVTVTWMCPGLTESEFHEAANHIKPKSMDPMFMTARAVAEIGVTAAERGRVGVTPGLVNKMMGWMMKWMPRGAATWMAGTSMKPRGDRGAKPSPAKARDDARPSPPAE